MWRESKLLVHRTDLSMKRFKVENLYNPLLILIDEKVDRPYIDFEKQTYLVILLKNK
jgi:hypothetical protein